MDNDDETNDGQDQDQTKASYELFPRRDGINRRNFIEVSIVGLQAVSLAAAGLKPGTLTAQPASAGPTTGTLPIVLKVNGRAQHLSIDPRTTLLDALRENLSLPGTKKGCDHGQCGACTVLVDGRRVLACLTLAAAASGTHEIVTIEGLATGEKLHPVQQAFLDCDGFQCGYCTPGQILSAVGLLSEGCPADRTAIRECMSGNICRCGAYPNIVDAVLQARKSV